MKSKIQTALKLISGPRDERFFRGLCLLMEVSELAPDALDPVARALLEAIAKPLIAKTEKHLGVPSFDDDFADDSENDLPNSVVDKEAA